MNIPRYLAVSRPPLKPVPRVLSWVPGVTFRLKQRVVQRPYLKVIDTSIGHITYYR